MQSRRSLEPCESHVPDDCVMSTRTNCALMGRELSCVYICPPLPLFTVPCGNVTHVPLPGSPMASAPFQYETTYRVANGSDQSTRITSSGTLAPRSTTTHCG